MKKQLSFFAAILMVVVLALSGCGFVNGFSGSSSAANADKIAESADTETPEGSISGSGVVEADEEVWKDITSDSSNRLKQEDLKKIFLEGFKAADGVVNKSALKEAFKWVDINATEVDGEADAQYELLAAYVKNPKTVVRTENIANSDLALSHFGLIEISTRGEATTLCWRLSEKGKWRVNYDKRGDAAAAKRFNVLVYGIDRTLTDEDVKLYILDTAQYRPDSLQAYYYAAFDVMLDVGELVTDPAAYAARKPTFMSAKAEAYLQYLKDALDNSTMERRELTKKERASLRNTGSNGNTFNKAYTDGIGGDDVLAIIFHLKNGRDVYALFRCGNPAISDGPGVPTGPTDDKPKPGPKPNPGDGNDPKNVANEPSKKAPAVDNEDGKNKGSDGSGDKEGKPKVTPPKPHKHKWGPWVVETAPKVGVKGWEVRTCKIDGKTEGRSIPALPAEKHQHDYQKVVVKNADVGVDGWWHYVCSGCGHSYGHYTIPALPPREDGTGDPDNPGGKPAPKD